MYIFFVFHLTAQSKVNSRRVINNIVESSNTSIFIFSAETKRSFPIESIYTSKVVKHTRFYERGSAKRFQIFRRRVRRQKQQTRHRV